VHVPLLRLQARRRDGAASRPILSSDILSTLLSI